MDHVLKELSTIDAEMGVRRLVLFGSRARGDHRPKSDYDIAVVGSLTEVEKAKLLDKVDEIETLKKIDLVFADDMSSKDPLERVEKKRVVFYEAGRQKDR